MDRMKACGAFDRGSNPLGRTVKKELQRLRPCCSFFYNQGSVGRRKGKTESQTEGRVIMNQAQRNPGVNRCLDGNQPQKTKSREEQVKELLLESQQKKRAEKELSNLLALFRGRKSLLQLLPVIKLRYSKSVLTVAIERIERRKDDLSIMDQIFFEGFKNSLKQG